MLRLCFLMPLLLAAACAQTDLSTRHGSPLHTYLCADGKTFEARQILSGEVEVTAGGKTRDVTDAEGDPVASGPRLIFEGDVSRLEGMPGGPYVACRLEM
jgi:hypothetical protein